MTPRNEEGRRNGAGDSKKKEKSGREKMGELEEQDKESGAGPAKEREGLSVPGTVQRGRRKQRKFYHRWGGTTCPVHQKH